MEAKNSSSRSARGQAEPRQRPCSNSRNETKESAALGKVSFWTVAVGEVGNLVFSVNFENFAAYGATIDKLNADPEFLTWQAKRLKLGATTWVRGNMATEIPI